VMRFAPGASGIALLLHVRWSAGQSHRATTDPREPFVSFVQVIENVPGRHVTIGWSGVPSVRIEPDGSAATPPSTIVGRSTRAGGASKETNRRRSKPLPQATSSA